MNNTRARFPEAKTILRESIRPTTWFMWSRTDLRSSGCQEIVYLLVDVDSAFQIFHTSDLCLNEMIAMHGRGNSRRLHTGGHKLKKSHLSEMSAWTITLWRINVIPEQLHPGMQLASRTSRSGKLAAYKSKRAHIWT